MRQILCHDQPGDPGDRLSRFLTGVEWLAIIFGGLAAAMAAGVLVWCQLGIEMVGSRWWLGAGAVLAAAAVLLELRREVPGQQMFLVAVILFFTGVGAVGTWQGWHLGVPGSPDYIRLALSGVTWIAVMLSARSVARSLVGGFLRGSKAAGLYKLGGAIGLGALGGVAVLPFGSARGPLWLLAVALPVVLTQLAIAPFLLPKVLSLAKSPRQGISGPGFLTWIALGIYAWGVHGLSSWLGWCMLATCAGAGVYAGWQKGRKEY